MNKKELPEEKIEESAAKDNLVDKNEIIEMVRSLHKSKSKLIPYVAGYHKALNDVIALIQNK